MKSNEINNQKHNIYKQNDKFEQMTKKPVEKLILSLALPTIISMLITTIYNTADTYFAGKINSNAIAAIGISYAFMSIVQSFGFLYGHGSGNYISKVLGEQNIEKGERMASIGIVFSLCTGVLIGIITFVFAENISFALGGTPSIKGDIVSYLRMLSFGIPFIMCGLTLNNQFRFQGNALCGMIGIIFGGILNIILDPIFMFTLNMGVKGAGLATSISQILSFFLLIHLNDKCGNVRLSIHNVKLSGKIIKLLYLGGTPNFARQTIAALAVLLLNHSAVNYGENAIASFTVVNRITMLFGASMIGFGQGFQPVCGYNYGAGLYKRVKQALKFCVLISSVFFILITVLCVGFAREILALFSNEKAVIELGVTILKYQCISVPLMGWIIMSGMFLQNIGRFKEATIVSAARQGIIFIPLILLLPNIWGLYGIMLVQPLSDIGTFIISLPMSIKEIKKLNGAKEYGESIYR